MAEGLRESVGQLLVADEAVFGPLLGIEDERVTEGKRVYGDILGILDNMS